MSFYQKHVFFCVNQRAPDAPRDCCGNHHAENMLQYAKAQAKKLNLTKAQGVRVQKAGCFERCEQGPLIVVYPEATWYTYVDEQDIDEILHEDIQNNRIVQRLKVDNHA